jgi:hypothetical protein
MMLGCQLMMLMMLMMMMMMLMMLKCWIMMLTAARG